MNGNDPRRGTGGKVRRHVKIMEIIQNRPVETQEELADHLRREGMTVTQATVSRDIKELQLLKVPTDDGRYRYAMPEEGPAGYQRERLQRLFRECLISVDHSENIVVIKTLSGTANTAAEALDVLKWEEIIGTVAGDNTVLAVVRPREAVAGLIDKLEKLME